MYPRQRERVGGRDQDANGAEQGRCFFKLLKFCTTHAIHECNECPSGRISIEIPMLRENSQKLKNKVS